MSTNGNGMDRAKAADVLRQFRRENTQDELRELVQTGGGLGESELSAAIDAVGPLRAEDILGVKVREQDLPGEQGTLSGGTATGDVSRSSAQPPPRGQTATLSGFKGSDDAPSSEERRLIDRAAGLATSTDPFSGDDPPTCTRLYTTVEQFIEMIESADRPPIGVDATREVADSLRSVTSNVDIAANTTGCFGDARGAVNRAMANAVSSIEAGEEPNLGHLRTVLQRARESGQGNR